ncbi:Armadillo/beta-catenin-like repeat [Musa troglodytarum]|uniref:Armadillo/beta-catenin-like repeat n=1 Tax=Musa troglodytarum TaxID=320322 RepID=A0A9E7GYJ4_9LILI|nr:Armadillo/beta-catenin-like repeat [Musa troglodytarum]
MCSILFLSPPSTKEAARVGKPLPGYRENLFFLLQYEGRHSYNECLSEPVALAHACANASQGLQERAAGALWGLSVSEANSIAIGREGGVAPLIALARTDAEDVHETAAGALWNLAFNSGNALRIIEEGGVPALVHLCSSSGSKMARFMAALALAYMFDGRMDEVALVGSSLEGSSKSVNFDGARRMALKHIEAFVLTFSDPQVFSVAASSSAPAALAQVADTARIQEAGAALLVDVGGEASGAQRVLEEMWSVLARVPGWEILPVNAANAPLHINAAEIGRYIAMLRNPSSVLRACAAFALLQFTIPGGRHAAHHASLLQKAGAARVLRATAAATTAPVEAKICARIGWESSDFLPSHVHILNNKTQMGLVLIRHLCYRSTDAGLSSLRLDSFRDEEKTPA